MIEINEEKRIFLQTYILYNNSGMLKPLFISKLEQYTNIFSQFTIFCEKKILKILKILQTTTKKFFKIKNNYTGEKQFSLAFLIS